MVRSWRQPVALSAMMIFLASCGGNVGMAGHRNDKQSEKAAPKTEPKTADSKDPTVVDQHTSGIIAKIDDEEEMSAVPPESIAGAYLTCDTIPTEGVGRQPAAGNGYYGCAAYKVDDSRLDLTGADVQFTLRSKASGLAITATRLELAERDEDAIWEAPAADLAAGVTADMVVKGTDGLAYTVKKRGSTTINDGTP